MSIVFKTGGRQRAMENRAGVPLSALAAEAGLPLNMQCGGQGACRGCLVTLGPGRYRINGRETVVADSKTLEVRACKTVVLSDSAKVGIPETSLLKIGSCASADFYATRKNLFQPLENAAGQLGIAVDIGTTTVAVMLVELSTGKILVRESAYNRQIELADNVASRIALCCEDTNLKKLQRLIIQETLFPMIGSCAAAQCFALQGHTPSQVLERVTQIVFSGNTVMSHLALGLSALSIGTIPFEPLTKVFSEHAAPEIGLTNCPNARVRTVPAVAGYVGGDIVSDIYVADLSTDRLELLVDIGTNGEIVLNDHGKLLATATAAGPAFEGAGLLHGCRADVGVIEQIVCHPDDSIEVETIGGRPTTGLCGSAAVDFIATARQTGLLNQMGRFDLNRLQKAHRLVQLDCHGMNVNACRITDEILITEFDISQILKAKAAVYAGIRTLVERSGRRMNEIERLVLAGGFAAHLRLENAMTIGLLPELSLSTYDVIGNGSLAGAYAALGVSKVWKELYRIAQSPDICHLAETNEFENRFIDALALPNLDPDEFLGVHQLLCLDDGIA
ncbi:MAG: ASKHA domain-containing protein [Kiritimatiellales bacterium]